VVTPTDQTSGNPTVAHELILDAGVIAYCRIVVGRLTPITAEGLPAGGNSRGWDATRPAPRLIGRVRALKSALAGDVLRAEQTIDEELDA
jgi:hypothetical protein